jgi:hypothetical protein
MVERPFVSFAYRKGLYAQGFGWTAIITNWLHLFLGQGRQVFPHILRRVPA